MPTRTDVVTKRQKRAESLLEGALIFWGIGYSILNDRLEHAPLLVWVPMTFAILYLVRFCARWLFLRILSHVSGERDGR